MSAKEAVRESRRDHDKLKKREEESQMSLKKFTVVPRYCCMLEKVAR